MIGFDDVVGGQGARSRCVERRFGSHCQRRPAPYPDRASWRSRRDLPPGSSAGRTAVHLSSIVVSDLFLRYLALRGGEPEHVLGTLVRRPDAGAELFLSTRGDAELGLGACPCGAITAAGIRAGHLWAVISAPAWSAVCDDRTTAFLVDRLPSTLRGAILGMELSDVVAARIVPAGIRIRAVTDEGYRTRLTADPLTRAVRLARRLARSGCAPKSDLYPSPPDR